MAQIATITLGDGQATPVNHTFVPRNPQARDEPAMWREKDLNSSLGDRNISLLTSVSKTREKVTVKLVLPVLVSPAGQPPVYEDQFVNISFSISPKISEASRKDIFAFAKNFIANAAVKAAVETGEIVY